MPELCNIQTYDRLDGNDYLPTLKRFGNVLKSIGVWNDGLAKSFDNFKWETESEEPVYDSINDYYLSKYSPDIKIRPYITVYTTETDNTFADNWISCELLINTEHLGSFETGYHSFVAPLVKDLTLEMFKEFVQPVYFTDEIQDGEDFDAIRTNDKSTAWQFDYAVLPLPLTGIYANVPKTHHIREYSNYVEAWYTERWT